MRSLSYLLIFLVLMVLYLYFRLGHTGYRIFEETLIVEYTTQWKLEVPGEYKGQKIEVLSEIDSNSAPHLKTLIIQEGITEVGGIWK